MSDFIEVKEDSGEEHLANSLSNPERRLSNKTKFQLQSIANLLSRDQSRQLGPKDTESHRRRRAERTSNISDDIESLCSYVRTTVLEGHMQGAEGAHLVIHANGAELRSHNHNNMKDLRNCCCCICCWDEQDDGLPPFCRHDTATQGPVPFWKVFHPKNRITNLNPFCFLFGTIGLERFDRKRKYYMGIAMFSTFLSILFTWTGSAGAIPDSGVVSATLWVLMRATNETTGESQELRMGLTNMIQRSEPCTAWSCETSEYGYFDGPSWPSSFHEEVFNECREVFKGEVFGLLLNAITIIFALIGTANRMR